MSFHESPKVYTAQKMTFYIKDFFSKCHQIRNILWIWSHLLKRSLNGKRHFLCSVNLLSPVVLIVVITLYSSQTNHSFFYIILARNHWETKANVHIIRVFNKLIYYSFVIQFCHYQTDVKTKNMLPRIAPYMSILKRRILMSAFFKSPFNYCPLVWMCHSQISNSKINRLYETFLRIKQTGKHHLNTF